MAHTRKSKKLCKPQGFLYEKFFQKILNQGLFLLDKGI